MWTTGWRDKVWAQLHAEPGRSTEPGRSIGAPWDIVVIGGGITGAGILREATRLGLRALLLEQNDFASGTSSRSSKLVHGGLRYLRTLQIGVTLDSVRERDRLLEEGPGLIEPLGFLVAAYEGDALSAWVFRAGLTAYDLLALRWSHRYYDAQDFLMLAPDVTAQGLQGGFRYGDAQTDDARLVLRVIREAVRAGGTALNYARVEELLRDETGQVSGVVVRDVAAGPDAGRVARVRARVVVNATGAWADRLRGQIGAPARIRPLRGSHLIFPAWKLPVAQAVSFLHPTDHRPVFVFPWEGVTLVGTTDVDHFQPPDDDPVISPQEASYLLDAVRAQFAPLHLSAEDVQCAFAGVRPVVGTGKADPSHESRDHVIWDENGLLTVTGGKLTTFRLIALDALQAVRHRLPDFPPVDRNLPVLDPAPDAETNLAGLPGASKLDEAARRRFWGRYGADAPALVRAARQGELSPIPGVPALFPGGGYTWAELRWAARAEGVVHLDDLLLRRVRLGLVAPEGGLPLLEEIRTVVQPELGWDDARWQAEAAAYADRWRRAYAPPAPAALPRPSPVIIAPRRRSRPSRTRIGTILLAGTALLAVLAYLRRRVR